MIINDFNRLRLIKDLVGFSRPLSEIMSGLAEYSWEYRGHQVVLFRRDIGAVINRYMSRQITLDDVRAWAALVKDRHDICYEHHHEGTIRIIVEELASPSIKDFAVIKKYLD